MTIQRQYSLPNCKLVLEGLPDESPSSTGPAIRPLIAILVSAECHFSNYEKPLTGGREFLESLVEAVSNYAQEFLSGISHSNRQSDKTSLVQLHRIDNNLHRLIVQPQVAATGQSEATPAELDLMTVQLFDLVEAVDQFFADAQTLPDLTLELAPLSKRYVAAQEPVVKRVMPAALGVSGLAAASVAFFLLPAPPKRAFPETDPANTSRPEEVSQNSADPSSSGLNSPSDVNASPAVSPSAIAASSTDSIETEQALNSEASSEPVSAPPDPQTVDSLLSSAPEIADAEKLDQLTQQLRSQLDMAWTQEATFEEDLVYRVGVAENGDILGFKYVNQASVDYVDQTPLLDLRYNPVDETASNQEPVGQFRVVFRLGGIVEVSPWNGRPSSRVSPLETLASLLIGPSSM